MRFEFTPEEARRTAVTLITRFKKQKMTVKLECAAWPDAPYRTTLVAVRAGRHVLVEAQGTLIYTRSLKQLAAWMAMNRHYAELFVAIGNEAVLQAGVLQEMTADGVGLLVVSDAGSVTEHLHPRNHALVITPDPTLKLGPLKREVETILRKFNEVDRKDGLRDMCEVVERLTQEVGLAACRKGWLKTPEADFRLKDWSNQINELSRREAFNPPRGPLVAAGLKDDLHSFRGARNLVDHKVSSRREDSKRNRQYAERMMQGPRLVAELLSMKRRIK